MNIEGNKVVLRRMEEYDKRMLQNLIDDPERIKITKGYSSYTSYAYLRNRFLLMPDSDQSFRRIIADKKEPKISLGIILLSHINLTDRTAEIYIKLIKSARKQGYGRDAVTAMVSYAFEELNLQCIYSKIMEHNLPSRRMFEQCGFTQEGMQKSRTDNYGHNRNVCFYTLSDEVRPRPEET